MYKFIKPQGRPAPYGRGFARGGPDSGFTLIELIVALAVIAVLFSVVIPPLMEYRETMSERELLANRNAINDAIRQCYALEGRYPPVTGDSGLDYLKDNYQIILKPHMYEYSYDIINGNPVLNVAAIDRK